MLPSALPCPLASCDARRIFAPFSSQIRSVFVAKKLQTAAEKVESEVVLRAQTPKPLNPPHTRNSIDNYQQMDGGTSADYLTARIARDRPDILERMVHFPHIV